MYEAVVPVVVSSVKFAHGIWKTTAHFRNLLINAPTAVAGPGCLAPDLGPTLNSYLQSQVLTARDQLGKPFDADHKALALAAGRGVAGNFDRWVHAVTVPGLPLFPMLVSVPGPMAPPMMSVPLPLSLFQAGGTAGGLTNQWQLQNAMTMALDGQTTGRLGIQTVNNVYSALAGQLAMYFMLWFNSQTVRNLLGTGPVARLPVGPVVAGHLVGSAPNLL